MNRETVKYIILTIVDAVFCATLLVMCASCKTTKTSQTDYQYTADDYQHTEHQRDTVTIIERVVVHDTVTIETERESETGVEFVAGGGTFNLSTGEATGVAKVTSTEREKALESRVRSLTSDLEQAEGRIKELTDAASHQDGELHQKKTKKTAPLWWTYLLAFAAGAAVVVALKKIPYTKPLMRWL